MVQSFRFSFIFYSCNARKTSSLHTIYFKTKHKQSNLLPSITIKYIFPSFRIRSFISITINTHIDCSKNSKQVFCAFSKQQQGALKVCLHPFSVTNMIYDCAVACLNVICDCMVACLNVICGCMVVNSNVICKCMVTHSVISNGMQSVIMWYSMCIRVGNPYFMCI